MFFTEGFFDARFGFVADARNLSEHILGTGKVFTMGIVYSCLVEGKSRKI